VSSAKDTAIKINPLAGKPAEPSMLVNVPKLVTAYYTKIPEPSLAEQRVAFGTSGHRGSAFDKTFNERQVLAISHAICRTASSWASMARCFWASTRTPFPCWQAPTHSKCRNDRIVKVERKPVMGSG
jgi:hypothetical protein